MRVKLEFKFVFNHSKQKYILSLVEGNLDGDNNPDLLFVMDEQQNEAVPLYMSYSCSEKRVLKSTNETSDGEIMELVLNGFQYQALSVEMAPHTNDFGEALDCSGACGCLQMSKQWTFWMIIMASPL